MERIIRPTLKGAHYDYDMGEGRLSELVGAGLATRKLLDQVLVCPECSGLPSVRPGCPECGSSWVYADELAHHFACGHVDHMRNFLQGDTVVCQKCKQSALTINIDYDVTAGLMTCSDCHWTGNQASLIAECLACDIRFLVAEAKTLQLWEYSICSTACSIGLRG
jgi:hypothetical protein